MMFTLLRYIGCLIRFIQPWSAYCTILLSLILPTTQASYDNFDEACNNLLSDLEVTENTLADFPNFLAIKKEKEVIYQYIGKKYTMQLLGKSKIGRTKVYLVKRNGKVMVLKKFEEEYPRHRIDLMQKGYLPYDYTPIITKKYMLIEAGDPIKDELYPATPNSMDRVIQCFDLCKKYGYKPDIKLDNMLVLKRKKKKVIGFIDFGIEGTHFYNGKDALQGIALAIIESRYHSFIEKLQHRFMHIYHYYKCIHEYTVLGGFHLNIQGRGKLYFLHNILKELSEITLVSGTNQYDKPLFIPSQNLFWDIIGKIATNMLTFNQHKSFHLWKKVAETNQKYLLYNSIWEGKKVNNQRYLSLLEAFLRMAGAQVTPFDRYLLRLGSGKVPIKNIDQVILKLIRLKTQQEERKEQVVMLPHYDIPPFEYELFNIEEWQKFSKLIKNNQVNSFAFTSFLQTIGKRVLRESCKITNIDISFFIGMVEVYEHLLIKTKQITPCEEGISLFFQNLRVYRKCLKEFGFQYDSRDYNKFLDSIKKTKESVTQKELAEWEKFLALKNYLKSYDNLLLSIEEIEYDNDFKKECKEILKTNIVIKLYNNLRKNNDSQQAYQMILRYLQGQENNKYEFLTNLITSFLNDWSTKLKRKEKFYDPINFLLMLRDVFLPLHRYNYNLKNELEKYYQKYQTSLKLVKESNEIENSLSKTINLFQSTLLNIFQIVLVNAVKNYFIYQGAKEEFYEPATLKELVSQYKNFLATEMNGQYKLPTDILITLLEAEWPELTINQEASELKNSIKKYVTASKSFATKYEIYLTPLVRNRMYSKLFLPLKAYINHDDMPEVIKGQLQENSSMSQYFTQWQEEQTTYLAALSESTEEDPSQDEERILSKEEKKIIEDFFPGYYSKEENKVAKEKPNLLSEKQNDQSLLDSSINLNPDEKSPTASPTPANHTDQNDSNPINNEKSEQANDQNHLNSSINLNPDEKSPTASPTPANHTNQNDSNPINNEKSEQPNDQNHLDSSINLNLNQQSPALSPTPTNHGGKDDSKDISKEESKISEDITRSPDRDKPIHHTGNFLKYYLPAAFIAITLSLLGFIKYWKIKQSKKVKSQLQ